jgi:orotate phosphoribosyltransferase
VNQSQILQVFEDCGALLKGHFLLSSGLHSSQYLQCARVLENPQISEKLSRALAENFKDDKITAVLAPAIGGSIISYELARILGARALFAEREAARMHLRRGFSLSSRDKVLICEDVITTGGSVKQIMELAESADAQIVAVCALADRSQSKIDFGVRCISLLKLEIKNYPAQDCPLCKQGIKLVKPGGRKEQ